MPEIGLIPPSSFLAQESITTVVLGGLFIMIVMSIPILPFPREKGQDQVANPQPESSDIGYPFLDRVLTH